MTNILLVTPENWFDLPRIAASASAPSTLTLTDAAGHQPLAGVALAELRAVHHTFGEAAAAHATSDRAAGVPSGEFTALLAESRALLQARAEAALADDGAAREPGDTLLAFPDAGHARWPDAVTAVTFLRPFLWLPPQAPSLLAWARRLAASDDAAGLARAHVWTRLVLQKVAVENRATEAETCLRAIYEGSDAARQRLLAEEARVLEACGLSDLVQWGRSLGLDRPARTTVGIETPARRPAPSGRRPDITVLVPSYAHEAYIEPALESVLAQTYGHFRLLVVDDQSPDDTVARARRLDDPRLEITVNASNLGLGDSVLAALEGVDTPYVALLNSDDLFHPERLARCRAAFDETPGTQVVATGLAIIDGAGLRLDAASVRRLFDGHQIADWVRWHADRCRVTPDADLLAELLERNFLVTSSNIVARTDFLRARRDVLRGLKYCLDWQILLEAAAARALVHLPEALLGYRLHGANTVWFDDERGDAYALEVNRVLAHAVRQSAKPGHDRSRPPSRETLATPADVAYQLNLLANRAARHSEANGLAMFATDLVGGGALEAARTGSAGVHDWCRALWPRFHADGSASASGDAAGRAEQSAVAAAVLADVAKEEAALAAGLRDAHDDLHRRLASREHAEADLLARITGLEAAAASQAEAHAEALAVLRSEMAALSSTHAAELQRVRRDQATSAAAHAEELARLRSDQVASAAAHADEQRRLRDDLSASAAAHAAEIQGLRSAPEWLVGDRLWNRAGLSRIGWPLVRRRRALRDRYNRTSLAVGRAVRTAGLGRPRAIVAACWSFPIHSQTFVYQEMQALAWAGFDTRVFCCDTNARQELPAAFSGLWGQRLVMQTDWDANQRDLDHFLQTRPARVESLLATLGEATGLTREALLRESIVRTGFTFARHVELAGATYLHTYFFYDQSLLGLMAAYLLQIPRGITAYADHMLGDYPFKLVALHLATADIVVATSARIKRELGEIGGGRFDDKIIVKPNGIDAARFPYVEAATRLAREGVPELVAVNRIEPKKGLIHLVDALGLLKDRGVAVTLNLVGGADKTPAGAECFRQITARIEALGLGDRIILHGVKQQHEFTPLMARSRLFVAPYVEAASGDKDGIPTAVLEAMSTGLPIVHTDAGSIEEAAADGVEGLTVPQRDAAALADAIERLLSDDALYTRMSNAARQRALAEFDIHVTETRLHERIHACVPRPH